MYSHDEMAIMMAETKFSPSYDMAKIVTRSGKIFLELKSIYHFYDFRTGYAKDNIDHLKKGRYFSVIVKSIKTTNVDNSSSKKDDFMNTKKLPAHPCILKCPESGKVNVFIPFCELIPIFGE